MEQDRHVSSDGALEDRATTSAMEILFQSVVSSWTPEKSVVSAVAVLLIGFISVYKVCISPILPIQVKCWFCNETNILPPDNRNQFDCRHCEQYNGFSPEGDYNKDIPAQRDPSINVFSAEARHSGAKLSMYHNGLCDLCNSRQARKMQARNQFQPSGSKREAQEFEEYCRMLDRNYPLCQSCDRHVSTRISYQNAYLDPYVKRWMSSRWFSRLGRFMFSEYMVLLSTFGPVASFYLTGWFQGLPLVVVLFLMLGGMAQSGFVLASFVLRATTVCTSQLEFPLEAQHRNILNIGSLICAFVAAFSTLQTIVLKLIGKKRKQAYPFSNVEDLSKILSPLLSTSYSKLKETQNWVQQKACSQLDSGFGALSLGKPSAKSRSGRAPTVLSSNVPKSFVFGKSTVNSPGILRPSRLSQSFEEFTPPPSQDTSTSGYFVSASRWCCGDRVPTVQEHDDANWDSRTTATQRTVHNVVYAPRESSQSAIWTVAVLLAALLLKLCWSDLLYAARAVYVSFTHVLV